jgi:hypothetical protein
VRQPDPPPERIFERTFDCVQAAYAKRKRHCPRGVSVFFSRKKFQFDDKARARRPTFFVSCKQSPAAVAEPPPPPPPFVPTFKKVPRKPFLHYVFVFQPCTTNTNLLRRIPTTGCGPRTFPAPRSRGPAASGSASSAVSSCGEGRDGKKTIFSRFVFARVLPRNAGHAMFNSDYSDLYIEYC